MGKTIRVFVVGVCISLCQVAAAAIWYVDGSVSESGDGTSWQTAVKTIYKGMHKAFEGDTVLVAHGTYAENVHFTGKNITLRSTDPLDPLVVAKTVIDCKGCGSVVTFSGEEDETCVLSGFTISGDAQPMPGSPYPTDGGGIHGSTGWYKTHATIQNNVITGNCADSFGGGLAYCDGTIRNNTISRNTAYDGGGGLAYCDGTIQNNTISTNGSFSGAGGLRSCNGMIENNTITDNWGEWAVGGLGGCNGAIRNNTISGNSTGDANGGGLCGCNGTIRNNIISDNHTTWIGGGLIGCSGTIQNNIITGNSAWSGGGLISCSGTIQNNLIAGNWAEAEPDAPGGGGLVNCGGIIQNNTIIANSTSGDGGGGVHKCKGTIRNCIIWANTGTDREQVYESSAPTYSCIEDWTGGGEGNIADDPRFVDRDGPDDNRRTYADNDYRLAADSHCIDAAVNEDWMWQAVDLDGNPRILPGASCWRVDMGAYEHISPTYKLMSFIRATDSGIQVIWTSQPGQTHTLRWSLDMLSGTWNDEPTILSDTLSTTWTDSHTSSPRKFYKIELE